MIRLRVSEAHRRRQADLKPLSEHSDLCAAAIEVLSFSLCVSAGLPWISDNFGLHGDDELGLFEPRGQLGVLLAEDDLRRP